MRTLVTLLLLTLVCFLSYSSAAPVDLDILMKTGCCEKTGQKHIPRGKVTNVTQIEKPTSRQDCKDAIIVKTPCNKTFCLDPNWTWAKNLLREFERSTANNSPPSAPFNVRPCTEMV